MNNESHEFYFRMDDPVGEFYDGRQVVVYYEVINDRFMRQLVSFADRYVGSNREDEELGFHLGEGEVDLEVLESSPVDTSPVSKEEFEEEWSRYNETLLKDWQGTMAQNPIGTRLECEIRVFYPHGAICRTDDGSYTVADVDALREKRSGGLYPQMILSGIVIGYDEVNMWLKVEAHAVRENS